MNNHSLEKLSLKLQAGTVSPYNHTYIDYNIKVLDTIIRTGTLPLGTNLPYK